MSDSTDSPTPGQQLDTILSDIKTDLGSTKPLVEQLIYDNDLKKSVNDCLDEAKDLVVMVEKLISDSVDAEVIHDVNEVRQKRIARGQKTN